jgi:hypothetical protein
VSGPTRLEVRKNGYVSQRHRIDVRAHQSADLGLPLAASRADISGVYTLTLRAADECAHFSDSNGMPQSLPEVARLRRYTAGITQDGPALRVQLSGATFATPAQSGGTGNSFGGRLEADRALSSSSPSEVTTGTLVPRPCRAHRRPDISRGRRDRIDLTRCVVERTTRGQPLHHGSRPSGRQRASAATSHDVLVHAASVHVVAVTDVRTRCSTFSSHDCREPARV